MTICPKCGRTLLWNEFIGAYHCKCGYEQLVRNLKPQDTLPARRKSKERT